MPSRNRLVLPGHPIHVTHRGNNRAAIFQDDEDRYECFDLLLRNRTKYSVDIHGYVFMDNHIHLLATPADSEGLAGMMRVVGSRYARHYNRRYGRVGAFWQRRYHSSLVQSSRYFFTCMRYIELNPMRALMVDRPEAHAWSSYQANALGITNALITPHELFRDLSANERDRCSAYRSMFTTAIDPADVETLRTAIRLCSISGDADFRRELTRNHRD